jgi:acetolactate synthase regulatory subunit
MSVPGVDGSAVRSLTRLLIAAALAAQMLLRVLGVVSRQSIVPNAVSANRSQDQLSVEMALLGLRDEMLERVRAQIAAITDGRAVRDRE